MKNYYWSIYPYKFFVLQYLFSNFFAGGHMADAEGSSDDWDEKHDWGQLISVSQTKNKTILVYDCCMDMMNGTLV